MDDKLRYQEVEKIEIIGKSCSQKRIWEKPVLESLDLSLTAAGAKPIPGGDGSSQYKDPS